MKVRTSPKDRMVLPGNLQSSSTAESFAAADESGFGLLTISSGPMTIRALATGCIYSITCNGIQINQVLASPLGGGVSRIYLRIREGGAWRFATIVGPGSSSVFAASADRFSWSGEWKGLRYHCTCTATAGG